MTMINKFRIAAVLATSAVIGGELLPAAHTAPGDPVISQRPLTQAARIKPAFMMALDNSGSMGSDETLCRTNQGGCFWNSATRSFFGATGVALETGHSYTRTMRGGNANDNAGNEAPRVDKYAAARDPEFNRAYFNPVDIYAPWVNYDGTPYKNGLVVDPITGNSPIAAAPEDPRHPATATDGGAGVTINFTSTVDVTYNYAAGDVLSAGTTYLNNNTCSNSPVPGAGGPPTNLLLTLPADITFAGNCTVVTKFYPATVYLTPAAAPPPGFNIANRLTIKRAGPGYTDLYKYEIIPANFNVAADYLAAVQNFANYWTYYGDRVRSVVAATTQSLTGVDFMRVGAFNINAPVTNFGADPKVPMYDIGDNSVGGTRSQFYSQLLAFDRPGNNTPTRRAVYRLGNQFRRVQSASDPNPPILLQCQVNAGMLFTDGYINDDNGGLPAVGNVDGTMGAPYSDGISNTMADIAAYSYVNNLRPDLPAGKVAVPAGCASGSPDPRLDCNANPHMNFYGIPLGARGQFYDVSPYVDNLATQADEATATAFVTPPAWSAKGLANNVGGTTDLSPPAVDDLWHASMNTRGKFISAQSPAAVRDGIREVLNRVLDSTLGSGSIAGSGARVPGDNVAITVEPAFKVGNNGTDWTGELTGYRVNADGTIGATAWTASSVLPAPGSRRIVTNVLPGNSSTRVAADFNAVSLGVNNAAQLLKLGLTPLEVATTFPGATSATLVSYLRGDRTNEISNGGIYRDRSGILGDIVNSTPLITSGKDDYGWATLDPTYSTFLAAKAARPAMVYVGANEGMLHAFDALTGVERFAFIPNGVLDNMGDLGSRFYPHRFYVDGDPVVTDAKIGGSWSTVLVGTTAAGGRSVFALNVDNPSGFTGSDVLWEMTSASDGDLGNTFGRPVVVPLESGGFGAIFGNGYGNNSNDPFLYVVDIGTGNVIAKLAPNDGNTNYNGLGQIAVVDANGNGKADTVYGADLQGNVWKFNIVSPTPASWNVAFGNNPLFTATDAGGVAQPITSDLEVATGPIGGSSVFFGTGRYFAENDNFIPATPQVQTLYSVSDVGTPAGTRANLVQQKITAENLITLPSGVVARSRQTTRNPTNFAKRGFYMDLGVDPGTGPIAKGEMFIGNPRIQSGKVFFTTFEPVGDPCSPGGRNWIYGLDLTSGGAALQNVQIDSSGTPACTGNCGALAIADGAPITDTSIFIPRPNPLPGLTCDPADPTCLPPPTLDDALEQCTLVIRAPGSPPLILPRPCGRQSWRQVR